MVEKKTYKKIFRIEELLFVEEVGCRKIVNNLIRLKKSNFPSCPRSKILIFLLSNYLAPDRTLLLNLRSPSSSFVNFLA